MKEYTFSDTDRLQEICKLLPDKTHTDGKLCDMLDELQELVELHPRNNLNLCISGGMHELFALIIQHKNEKVRKLACLVIAAACSNNSQVQ